MEILVIHPGALGDIILSLPALRILRDQFQSARITLAANEDFGGTVASGYADRILSFSSLPLHRLYGLESIPLEDRQFWRSFDRILSWTGAGAGSFTSQVARVHPCSLVAPWKPVSADLRHVARIFADSLHPWLPLPVVLPPLEIRVSEFARSEGSEWLKSEGFSFDRPIYILHPGAGSAAKRWPLSRFEILAHKLSVIGELLIVEGPAEQGLGRDLVAAHGVGAHLAAQLPLSLLAAVISECRAFVGNDSGIAHLAAGLGIQCVVIFGPTLPEHWAPLGRRVSAVRDAGGCFACRQDPNANHSCLENITVDAVWQELKSN